MHGLAVPEITVDRHQGFAAQHTRLFKTDVAERGAGRLQADTGSTRGRQINLDDVQGPWPINQMDGMMPYTGCDRLGFCRYARSLAAGASEQDSQCQRLESTTRAYRTRQGLTDRWRWGEF